MAQDDIPEVFRRAFEREGWNGGRRRQEGQNGSGPRLSGRWLWLLLILFLLFISFNWMVTTYTEWLWFSALGYRAVWLKQWGAQVISFVLFFIVAAGILLVNWRLARASAAREGGRDAPLQGLPGLNWLIAGAGLMLAFIFAGAAASQWPEFLRFLYRVPFDASGALTDPIFGRDISFYLFELPVYRFLRGWLIPLLVFALIGVLFFYGAGNWQLVQGTPSADRPFGRPALRARSLGSPEQRPAARRHVALLGVLILGFWALGYWFAIYGLMYSSRGVAFGVSYTDLNAKLPALWAQLVTMALLAIAVAYNYFRLDLRPVYVTAALWLVATVLMGGIYPSVLQRYAVEPNELALERPFIENNIAFTRLGFGLQDTDSRPFNIVTELDQQDLEEAEVALRNVRLWDYRPLQQSYAQLQALRPYYHFSSIDVDRYLIEGTVRQVMLAARELNKEQLSAPSWVNQKLEFTHGYGVVMNPVDEISPEGRPVFFIKDLPPQSTVPIEITRPEIYFGETMSDTVFVASDLEEFNYPQGNENVYSSYEGQGGVLLSSLLRRLAFAIRFSEANLLLSQYITPDTRVLMHRQIRERVERITPFLALDNDPYLVVAGGRLIWMLDAYTLSRNFPYATPAPRGFNYIRNAAKITIDAYDGTVTYYLTAPDDPLIQAYALAFPNLFQPLEAMPENLQAHIRYPEDLFRIQTQQFLKYHMTDVQVFYNQEDLWEIPQEIFDAKQQPIEPYYVITALPEEEKTEFMLIQPFTPAGKTNMIAWIAGRSDPPHYGELVVYELPKQELIFGPIQVEGRIDQDPQISQQLTLWNQQGSSVIRGNLIVLPLNDSFLYIEPLYLLSDTSALPELRRVIVASGNRIAMRPTLPEALAALLLDAPSVGVIDETEEPPDGGGGGDNEAGQVPPALDATVEELIASANAHFEAAQAAQREGDWATYGRELQALEQALARLLALSQ